MGKEAEAVVGEAEPGERMAEAAEVHALKLVVRDVEAAQTLRRREEVGGEALEGRMGIVSCG